MATNPNPIGTQRRDTTATYSIGPVADVNGNKPGTFTGSEPIVAYLWNVSGGQQVALPAPAWQGSPPTTAMITLTVPASVVSALAPELYNLSVTVTQSSTPLDAYTGSIKLLDSGTAAYSPTTTITKARLESLLLRRCSAIMSVAKMDATTQDGTNLDLNDPLSRAARFLGLTMADQTYLQDSDLLSFQPGNLDVLLLVAEYQLRLDISGRFIGIDISNPQFAAHWEQFTAQNQKVIDQLRKRIEATTGIAVGTLDAGDPYHPVVPQNAPYSHLPPPPYPLTYGFRAPYMPGYPPSGCNYWP